MATAKSLLAILELDTNVENFITRTRFIARRFGYDVTLALAEPDSAWLPAGWAVSSEVDEIRREFDQTRTELVEEYATTLRDAGLTVSTKILTERPLGDTVLHLVNQLGPAMIAKAIRYHSAAERSIFVDTDWQLIRVCACPIWFVKSEPMPEHPPIIAAVDPALAHDKPVALDDDIVRTALAIARKVDGEVHLLHTYLPLSGVGKVANRTFKPTRLSLQDIDARLKAEHRQALNGLAQAHGIAAERVHQLPGRASEILPTFARARKAGLVVMGALARWGVKRMAIGSTAERTLDHLPCDVLIVHPGEQLAYG
jgi:universal stress protein E